MGRTRRRRNRYRYRVRDARRKCSVSRIARDHRVGSASQLRLTDAARRAGRSRREACRPRSVQEKRAVDKRSGRSRGNQRNVTRGLHRSAYRRHRNIHVHGRAMHDSRGWGDRQSRGGLLQRRNCPTPVVHQVLYVHRAQPGRQVVAGGRGEPRQHSHCVGAGRRSAIGRIFRARHGDGAIRHIIERAGRRR